MAKRAKRATMGIPRPHMPLNRFNGLMSKIETDFLRSERANDVTFAIDASVPFGLFVVLFLRLSIVSS